MYRQTQKDKNIKLSCVILTLIFSFFLIINFITPLMGEDLVLVAFPKNYHISSFRELLLLASTRIYDQMTNWNVRIGEQISIIFSCFDKGLFNIFNSMVAMIYISLIYQYAFKKPFTISGKNVWYFFMSFCIIVFAQPVLGEIFFWRTGSTNYLWALCLLLIFALPLRYYIGYDSIDIINFSKTKLIFLTFLGFIVGFTNENTIVVFITLYLGTIIYNWRKHRYTPLWIYTSGISLTLGFICMYKAPSTKIRANTYLQMFGIEEVTFNVYLIRAQNIIFRFFSDNRVLVIITISSIIIYGILLLFCKSMDIHSKKEKFLKDSENLGILLVSSLSCGALVMSPYVETRAFLLPDFLMICCIIYYIDRIISLMVRWQKTIYILSGSIMFLFVCYQYSQIYDIYSRYNNFVTLRNSEIELQDNDTTFLWGEWQGDYSSRLLTSREDYLLSNETALNYYYGKKIQCWNNYLININFENYEFADGKGYIDNAVYDVDTDTLSVYGWSTFPDLINNNTRSYIYLQINNQNYYFKVQPILREDVVHEFNNSTCLNSGFRVDISSLKGILGYDINEISVGILLTNNDYHLISPNIDEKVLILNK